MSLSSVLNCCRYFSLEACGTAQSLKLILGELLVSDVVEEEFELLDPRSSKELAFDMPVDGEKAMGEEKPERGSPALLGTRGEARRLTLPLWSPETSGRVSGVGIRGCREGMGGLAGMGVRMGMADRDDMDDTPTDRLGIEPIPNRADEGIFEPQLDAGGCFMTTGKEGGKFLPCSVSLMSFIAIENSSLSIFPSLSRSAKFQISASTEAGRPDWRKNFLACSPDT